MTSVRAVPILLAGALLLSACGAAVGGTSSSSSSNPGSGSGSGTAAAACPGASGEKAVSWTAGGTVREALAYAAAASAPTSTAVVVSNQSDQTRCSWAPYLAALRSHGTVWLYDYDSSGGTAVEDVQAVVAQARMAGAQQVVLVGASKGAKASLVAAAALSPGPLAVVALSPEGNLADGTPVLGKVAGATFPTLIVTAEDDPYQAAPASRALQQARPSVTTLVLVPGSDHGTALLGGAAAARVVQAVDQFLGEHPGS